MNVANAARRKCDSSRAESSERLAQRRCGEAVRSTQSDCQVDSLGTTVLKTVSYFPADGRQHLCNKSC